VNDPGQDHANLSLLVWRESKQYWHCDVYAALFAGKNLCSALRRYGIRLFSLIIPNGNQGQLAVGCYVLHVES
jgi:hypothetical protein